MSREGFVDDTQEGQRRRFPTVTLPTYAVWNPNPKNPGSPVTPGIKMTVVTGEGDDRKYATEVTESLNAVILFRSVGRSIKGDKGRIVCQSHGTVLDDKGDKLRPSLRITQPQCRNATAQDVAQVFAKWKGFDQAKIDAKVEEVTDGTGCLQVCGLKGKDGRMIPLCPSAQWGEYRGKKIKPDCQPNIFVHGYDLDRNREFKMELTGNSIRNDERFRAPFFEFFKHLRTTDAACFQWRVKLSGLKNGDTAFYVLNVTDFHALGESEVKKMEQMALDARERYIRQASWLSKEAYDAQRKQAGATGTTNATDVGAGDTPKAPSSPPAPVSFDDDDIPF